MGKSVGINALGDHAAAVGHGQERHELGLKIGGKTRIHLGRDIERAQSTQAPDPDTVRFQRPVGAHLSQSIQHEDAVVGAHAAQEHVALGDRRGGRVRPGLDAIWNI